MTRLMLRDFDKFIQESFGYHGNALPNNGFPYFDIIERTGDAGRKEFVVKLAIAGYSADNIDVYIERNSLCIDGKRSTVIKDEEEYLYKGISRKNFSRRIAVPNETQIKSATLKNGILDVVFYIDVPQKEKIKIIEVNDG